MTHRTRILAAAVVSLLAGASAQAATDKDAETRALEQMDWIQGPGTVEISELNAQFALDEGDALLRGEDAVEYARMAQGSDSLSDSDFIAFQNLDLSPEQSSETYFAHFDIGYIEDDSWRDLDAEQVLASIREKTAASNQQRRKNGFPEIEVLGWASEPHYGRDKRVVYWAVRVRTSNGANYVNVQALKLARDGFTRMIWVGEPPAYDGQTTMANLGDDFRFKEGNRYVDYRDGDVVAGVGLAGLVAGLANGKGWQKAAATGLMATLAAFAKKLWWLAILPFVWLARRVFGTTKNET